MADFDTTQQVTSRTPTTTQDPKKDAVRKIFREKTREAREEQRKFFEGSKSGDAQQMLNEC